MSWVQTLRTLKCHQGSLEVTCSPEYVLPQETIGSLSEAHREASRPEVFLQSFQKILFVLRELPKKENKETLSEPLNRDLLTELRRSHQELRIAKDKRPPHVEAETELVQKDGDDLPLRQVDLDQDPDKKTFLHMDSSRERVADQNNPTVGTQNKEEEPLNEEVFHVNPGWATEEVLLIVKLTHRLGLPIALNEARSRVAFINAELTTHPEHSSAEKHRSIKLFRHRHPREGVPQFPEVLRFSSTRQTKHSLHNKTMRISETNLAETIQAMEFEMVVLISADTVQIHRKT